MLRKSDAVKVQILWNKMRQTSGGWVTVLEEPQVTKEVLNLKEFLGTDKVRFIHSFNDRGSVFLGSFRPDFCYSVP